MGFINCAAVHIYINVHGKMLCRELGWGFLCFVRLCHCAHGHAHAVSWCIADVHESAGGLTGVALHCKR
jgi:hypothetical protein